MEYKIGDLVRCSLIDGDSYDVGNTVVRGEILQVKKSWANTKYRVAFLNVITNRGKKVRQVKEKWLVQDNIFSLWKQRIRTQ